MLYLLLVPQRRTRLALGIESQTPVAYPVADSLAAELLVVAAIASFSVQVFGHGSAGGAGAGE